MKKLLISLICAMMCFANITMIQAEAVFDHLNTVIATAETLNVEMYSYDSFSAMETKLAEAKALSAEASQENVDAAAAALQEAMDALAPRYENLALNAKVTASSSYNSTSLAASKATDGDISTRWSNNYNSTAYKNGNHKETITFDLGKKQTVDAVEICWESANASSYVLQGSINGTDFFNIRDVAGAGGNEVLADLGNVTVRYLRLACNEARTKYGYGIYEFRAFKGNPYATVYTNIAYKKAVEVSSAYEGEKFVKQHLTDGNMTTRWGSNYAITGWAKEHAIVDLGEVYDVDRINVVYEAAYATKYQLFGSTDGITYEPITDELAGTTGTNSLTKLNAKVRYVKVQMNEASGRYGYSIYEIEVFAPRKVDLQKSIEQYEAKLNSYVVGEEEGMMSEAHYQSFMAILNDAKAMAQEENVKDADITTTLGSLKSTIDTMGDVLIGGKVQASIYPVPQHIANITETGMRLPQTVDILVHGEQDVATLPKLEALLDDAGIYYDYVDEKGELFTITLATKAADHNDCAICNIEDSENVLVNEQAYILETSEAGITIVGSDADGAYYGLMSLYQLFKQRTSDGRMAQVKVSDYPDVKFRGYVEGFYGIPWTYNDRKELFEDTTMYKMTTYIYAPKDDPYHREQWRTLYPEEKAVEMRDLAQIATENNMEFCWTIHPGEDYNYTKDSDGDGVLDDYQKLIDKFEQVYSFGVRQFGIFYDDLLYSLADGTKHAETINAAYEYLTTKYDDVKPFITVVTRYTNSWGADWNSYFKPFMQTVHEDTQVLWTGQSTMSAITKAYMEVPKTKTGVDRDFGVWWNFPVNDYFDGHLLMGSLDCLSNDVDNIASFFLNPLSEADASKVAIYSGADYSWNIEDFDSTESWKRAIYELVPEANEAFERFADNLAYVDKGNGFFFDESKYMKADIDLFMDALADGYDSGENAAMLAHFTQMKEDAALLHQIKDKALYDEIVNYLYAYEGLADAGIAAMNAFEAAVNGDIQGTMDNYSAYQDGLTEANAYYIPLLSGKARASVGDYRIQPFLFDLDGYIMGTLGSAEGGKAVTHMITNVELLNTQPVEKNTISNITTAMKQDDYVGIALAEVANLYEVKAVVSEPEKVKLQYSLNGTDWMDADAVVSGNSISAASIVTAAYARLVALEDIEITIDSFAAYVTYDPAFVTYNSNMPVYQTYTLDKAFDGDLTTNFWSSAGTSEGDHMTVDLGAESYINEIVLYSGINKHGEVDAYASSQLQVSNDGTTWKNIGEPKVIADYADHDSTMKKIVYTLEGVTGRYFRFLEKGTTDAWSKVYEITFDTEYVDYESRVVYSTNKETNLALDAMLDSYLSTSAKVADSSAAEDYLQVDLGTLIPLYDFNVYFVVENNVAKAYNGLKLQTSVDGVEWKDVAEVASENYVTSGSLSKATMMADGSLVRYIRLNALADNDAAVEIAEIQYNAGVASSTEIKNVTTNMETYQSYVIANAFDKRLETKFYAKRSIKTNDYVQIDMGAEIVAYDASIYFGGDPRNSNSFDGFKTMDVMVSKDGSTWTKVTSAQSSSYVVVGDHYLASVNLGGILTRYIKFVATSDSTSWLQVYEVQVNNTVNLNTVRFVDDLGTVKISNSNLLNDGNYSTSGFMYEVNNGDALVYPFTTITEVTSFGILQAYDFITNATVSVQDVEGNWSDVGTLSQAWNTFDVNQKLKAVKLTFDGSVTPTIYEIQVDGKADYTRVEAAKALVPAELDQYTSESVEALNTAVNAVVYEKAADEQLVVDEYANAIHDAIRGLETSVADYTLVDQAIAAANALDANLYIDFSAVEAAINAVVYDKAASEQAIVDGYAEAINNAVSALQFKAADYTAVETAVAAANALNAADYKDFSAVQAAVDAVVYDKDIRYQAEVDAMAQAINDAIAALEEKTTQVSGLVAVVDDYKTITLNWDELDVADEYVVERFNTTTNEWMVLETTTETTYTATGLKTGKEYTYRVSAIIADEKAEPSEAVKVTPMLSGEVELTLANNGRNKFDLTWTAVDGATRYIIYRKANNGEWKKVLTLGKDARSYTTKEMVDGTYAYQVKAARYDSVDRVMSAGSNIETGIAIAEALVLTATQASDTQVTLTWNELASMKYYDVYRATSLDGKYTLLKRTSDTTAQNSVKAGKTYYYKVRAYNLVDNVKVYSAYSEVVNITVQ